MSRYFGPDRRATMTVRRVRLLVSEFGRFEKSLLNHLTVFGTVRTLKRDMKTYENFRFVCISDGVCRVQDRVSYLKYLHSPLFLLFFLPSLVTSTYPVILSLMKGLTLCNKLKIRNTDQKFRFLSSMSKIFNILYLYGRNPSRTT